MKEKTIVNDDGTTTTIIVTNQGMTPSLLLTLQLHAVVYEKRAEVSNQTLTLDRSNALDLCSSSIPVRSTVLRETNR